LKKSAQSLLSILRISSQSLFKRLPIKNPVIIETVVAFLILDGFNRIFFAYDMGFKGAILHPYWLIILLISCRYGFGPGLFSGIVAASYYVLFIFAGLPSRPEIEKIAETNGLLLPITFIAVGVMVGSIRQRHLETEVEQGRILKKAQESVERLQEWLSHSEKARAVLENRIVGHTMTVKTLYEISRKLDSWDNEEIYQACLEILGKHFSVERASFYLIEGEYFVLKSAWGWTKEDHPQDKIFAAKSLMEMAVIDNKLVTVKDMLRKEISRNASKLILAMFPIHGDMGNPIGVVNIERMDFYHFNQQNLKTIGLVIDWTGQALARSKFFHSLKEKAIYDEEYDMYTYAHFKDILKNEFLRARTFGLDLAVSLIKLDNFNLLEKESQKLLLRAVSALLKRFMNKTDMIFRYRVEGTFAVISPMRKKEDITMAFTKITEGFNEVCRTELLSTLYEPNVTIHVTELHQDIKDPVELVGYKVL